MATELQAQLAQLAASSKTTFNVKAQKAAHSKSLIFEPRVAATQNFQTLYKLCFDGFEELCQLDERFKPFGMTLFSEQSQDEDRTQMTAAENEELDKKIESFLRLVGGRLRLSPAVKGIEWLIRRFQVHEYNTTVLLTTFLPYHGIPSFVTLLSILPSKIPAEYRFLDPYIRSFTSPPRSVIVYESIRHPSFLGTISEYTLESCRREQQYPALILFWAGIMTESVNGMLENMRSGRQSIQQDNDQALLQRLGPIFNEALLMKKVPNMQIASYMAVSVLAAKGNLHDVALSAFMDQIVLGWTNETVRPGLVCLSMLAQYRSAKQMPARVTRSLLKVQDLGKILVEIGQERRVDKLTNGLCIALVERLCKKGDSRGLPIIRAVLTGQVLKDKQIAVIFKSLLLAAHRLDDQVDEDGRIRKELGSTLIDLSRATGTSSEIIQTVIQEVDFDVEELEMKLDVSIRLRKVLEPTPKGPDDAQDETPRRPVINVRERIEQVSPETSLPTSLSPEPGADFEKLCGLFLMAVSEHGGDPEIYAKFESIRALRRRSALTDCTYITFFIRIWCGPYPTLARAAALDMVKTRLRAGDGIGTDFQALLPYCFVGLLDSSKKVRRASADLLAVIGTVYSEQQKTSKANAWGLTKQLYRDGSTLQWMDSDATYRLLHAIVLPALEECIMQEDHLAAVLCSFLDSAAKGANEANGTAKRALSQATRLSILSFLASHVIATPMLRVKANLLKVLNRIKGVSTTTRTQLLLPAFRWWAALSNEETGRLSKLEDIDEVLLHTRFAEIIVPNSSEGYQSILAIIKEPASGKRPDFVRSLFSRLRAMWPLMKPEMKFNVAQTMLECYQQNPSLQESENIISDEAADLLRNVELTTDILSHFLESIQTGTKMITEPPPNRRRRTSASEFNRGVNVQNTADVLATLKTVTFVLQLVEGSAPETHPELLESLFNTLSELQHFRTVVGSDLGYLQNLVLTSLIAMIPAYKANKSLKIASSGGHGDLLVNCIQKSSSPIVQNSALLLIASLATAAPDLVLHSVMPIFTFMGASVLRQNDDYSAHVVNQTIKEVIPPLMQSLRKGKRNPVAGASELLVSFVTAYEHVPSHRKRDLFVSLVNTLGPQEFLFALIAMLVDRYGADETIKAFIADLLDSYNAEIQLESLVKLLDLVSDLYRPKAGLSSALLGVGEDVSEKDQQQTALRQLSVFPSLLSSKKLKRDIGAMTGQDDMEASKVRELYAALLEGILTLADTVKGQENLHESCGLALSNLLNLLSIGEFIKAVENLLDRTNIGLRQKVLRALGVRIEQENNTDVASRTVLLAFLPQLTAAIRDTTDIKYKHTAVACVDKIAEKYGKKDLEAVAAAASTIAGAHCLGQPDVRLRVMALLCLASLVDVLQDSIVPVLPMAIPQAILYIHESLDAENVNSELHNAGFALITSLAQHLPYMLSGMYLDKILVAANTSAESGLDNESNSSRINCLRFVARQVDPKVMFTSLERNWSAATQAGYQAIKEYLDILGDTIDGHSKSTVTKNISSLSLIFLNAFDLRRQDHLKAASNGLASQRVTELETLINEVALKMIYRLNDAAFRPIFSKLVEWTSSLAKHDTMGRALRQHSIYGFLQVFFDNLKSIVTSYATYVVDDAVSILKSYDPKISEQRDVWERVLKTLAKCFEHDQDDFWQAPAHFGAVSSVLTAQFLHAATVDLSKELIPAVVELATAADSQEHQKELNSAILRHLRADQAAVRLAAVKCQQAMTDRIGEEWLSMLPEMLPYISELQEDDDEVVERETHRWIVKIEGVLGESLDSMLQ